MLEIKSGADLEDAVVGIGKELGLAAEMQVALGRRIWGPRRHIDVVFSRPSKASRLGVECWYQGTPSTDEERIPLLLQDIGVWPICGVLVVHGDGFSPGFITFVRRYGQVIELEDLDTWLRLHFHLPLKGDA